MRSFGLSFAFGVAFVVACIVAMVAIDDNGAYLLFGVPALGVAALLALSVVGWRKGTKDDT